MAACACTSNSTALYCCHPSQKHFRPNPWSPQRERTDGPMIPTPDLSHLNNNDYERVYEPAGEELNIVGWLEHLQK
jgi:hypothetical protein